MYFMHEENLCIRQNSTALYTILYIRQNVGIIPRIIIYFSQNEDILLPCDFCLWFSIVPVKFLSALELFKKQTHLTPAF